ncbi:EF-hand domain-containing protein [Ensifer soli]|uniref:EF-hand domain-containing protein n=1 Tax=Ciceribacter sp. sgz301302 TaxID=3342379 RepID=UPI0035BA9249
MTIKTPILAALAASLALGGFGAPAFANAGKDKPSREARAMQMIERLDTNKDSKVSLDEMKLHVADLFKAFDANGDGKVTKDEIKARQAAFREARKAVKDARATGGAALDEARAALQAARPAMLPGARPKMFDRVDTDRNGSLDAAEVTAAAEAMFKRRDRNGDGVIDAADIARKI